MNCPSSGRKGLKLHNSRKRAEIWSVGQSKINKAGRDRCEIAEGYCVRNSSGVRRGRRLHVPVHDAWLLPMYFKDIFPTESWIRFQNAK